MARNRYQRYLAPQATAAPEDRWSLVAEYLRLLVLGTAPLGGCAWLVVPGRLTGVAVMVAASVWIAVRAAGLVRRPWLSVLVSLAGAAAILGVWAAMRATGEHGPGAFPPFSPPAYLLMLATILVGDLRCLGESERPGSAC